MKIKRSKSGSEGEKVAGEFLKKKGYKILKTNYRVSGSEVDLIARKDDVLCFIEVKTRGTDDFGLPEEYVDRRKRAKIIRAARIFASDDKFINCFIRFDIISVLYAEKKVEINHIQHAFEG